MSRLLGSILLREFYCGGRVLLLLIFIVYFLFLKKYYDLYGNFNLVKYFLMFYLLFMITFVAFRIMYFFLHVVSCLEPGLNYGNAAYKCNYVCILK